MSEWIYACADDDLAAGIGVCASVRGRQVAVFRLPDNRLFAIDNHDPFSGSNVLSRGISGDLDGEPVVASPIYKQHFNLSTGQCLEDDSVRLDVFDVKLLDGQIRVTEIYLANLREKLQKLQTDASRFQPYNSDPNAPPIHDWLAKELSNTLNSILVYEKTLDDTRVQQSQLVAKFDKDIDRFKHLKGLD